MANLLAVSFTCKGSFLNKICVQTGCLRCLPLITNRLYAISAKLSPEQRSSGIEVLEADSFKLHCYQTHTGEFEGQLTTNKFIYPQH